MTSLLMGVLVVQALGFLIGWASVFWFKRIRIDIGDIGIDAVCPGLALLVIGAMFLLFVVNAIDYQRWLNSWRDDMRRQL